jgi:hypothetical protein
MNAFMFSIILLFKALIIICGNIIINMKCAVAFVFKDYKVIEDIKFLKMNNSIRLYTIKE